MSLQDGVRETGSFGVKPRLWMSEAGRRQWQRPSRCASLLIDPSKQDILAMGSLAPEKIMSAVLIVSSSIWNKDPIIESVQLAIYQSQLYFSFVFLFEIFLQGKWLRIYKLCFFNSSIILTYFIFIIVKRKWI